MRTDADRTSSARSWIKGRPRPRPHQPTADGRHTAGIPHRDGHRARSRPQPEPGQPPPCRTALLTTRTPPAVRRPPPRRRRAGARPERPAPRSPCARPAAADALERGIVLFARMDHPTLRLERFVCCSTVLERSGSFPEDTRRATRHCSAPNPVAAGRIADRISSSCRSAPGTARVSGSRSPYRAALKAAASSRARSSLRRRTS